MWFGKKDEKSANICFYALGTINNITVNEEYSHLLDAAMGIVYDIDNKMSVFRDNSEVSQINKNAGIQPVKVSNETFYVIEKSIYYSQILKGALDITVRPLVKLWHEHCEKSNIPPAGQIKDKLKLVNYKSITLNKALGTVYLDKPHQETDLGSIAKGYAADMVKKFLLQNSVKNALINLGGNVMVLGCGTGHMPVKVGIQDPDSETGVSMGVIEIADKSVVTSAGNERYYVISGEKYHHIIDPRTGYPSNSGIKSATVIYPSSCEADAMATGLFVSGLKDAASILKNFPDIDVILITNDNTVYLTKNIMSRFKIMNRKYSCQLLF